MRGIFSNHERHDSRSHLKQHERAPSCRCLPPQSSAVSMISRRPLKTGNDITFSRQAANAADRASCASARCCSSWCFSTSRRSRISSISGITALSRSTATISAKSRHTGVSYRSCHGFSSRFAYSCIALPATRPASMSRTAPRLPCATIYAFPATASLPTWRNAEKPQQAGSMASSCTWSSTTRVKSWLSRSLPATLTTVPFSTI